jgi:hypothetical protein
MHILSLALVDAVYSIRSRYPAVKRVVAAYSEASATACLPLAARSEPGFREQGLDCLLEQAETLRGEALAPSYVGVSDKKGPMTCGNVAAGSRNVARKIRRCHRRDTSLIINRRPVAAPESGM